MTRDPEKLKGPKGPSSVSEFADRLRIVERQFNNRAEVSKAIGVAKSSYQRWVEGVSTPSFDAMAKLAKVAGVSLDWLAFGDGQGPDGQAAVIDRAALAIDNERIDKITNSFYGLYSELAGKYDEQDLHSELDRVIAMYNLTIDLPDMDELDRGLKIAMKMHGDSLIDKAKVRREKLPETPTTKRRA